MEKTTYAEFLATLDPKLSKAKRQAAINEGYDAMGLMRGVYGPKDEPEAEMEAPPVDE